MSRAKPARKAEEDKQLHLAKKHKCKPLPKYLVFPPSGPIYFSKGDHGLDQIIGGDGITSVPSAYLSTFRCFVDDNGFFNHAPFNCRANMVISEKFLLDMSLCGGPNGTVVLGGPSPLNRSTLIGIFKKYDTRIEKEDDDDGGDDPVRSYWEKVLVSALEVWDNIR
jgi:hypothetical protein